MRFKCLIYNNNLSIDSLKVKKKIKLQLELLNNINHRIIINIFYHEKSMQLLNAEIKMKPIH